ncbi:MAG TPA: hypothetical protein VHE09_11775 [Rhizomicrobium sp.]|jgi:hypothetical protein|nr:hypothetical protein [Rhizomicrobium sp.]
MPHHRSSRLAVLSFAAVLLAGCVNELALDTLSDTKPESSASPFNKALFRNYSALAHSFGPVGVSAGKAFDKGGSIELTAMDSSIGGLANDYAEKALIAGRGAVVEPEPGIDIPTHKTRDRLIRAIERGRDKFPVESARAQADYDCWMMNATVPKLRRASSKCKASLDISLAALEAKAKPAAPPPEPEPAPSDNSDKPAIQP